jgi:RpiB/LacA/LacB family sugar-phosphate isomerase
MEEMTIPTSRAVAEAVQRGEAERGVIICGSGVGACVAANKSRGVRAGLCHDTYSAHQGFCRKTKNYRDTAQILNVQ